MGNIVPSTCKITHVNNAVSEDETAIQAAGDGQLRAIKTVAKTLSYIDPTDYSSFQKKNVSQLAFLMFFEYLFPGFLFVIFLWCLYKCTPYYNPSVDIRPMVMYIMLLFILYTLYYTVF